MYGNIRQTNKQKTQRQKKRRLGVAHLSQQMSSKIVTRKMNDILHFESEAYHLKESCGNQSIKRIIISKFI